MQGQRERNMIRWVAVPLMVLAFSSVCSSAPLVVERNLFAQDRKPPTDEPASPQRKNSAGLSPKAIQLDGVFIHGDKKEALLRLKGRMPGKSKSKDPSPYVKVREGERIDDYQVVKIESRSVSLEKDGQTFVVNLFAEGKIVPPAPPVPAAPGSTEPPPEGQGGPQGQGTMRLPRPIPPPGQGGGQRMPVNPNMEPPQPGQEHATEQEAQPPDDEGEVPFDEEDQTDEELPEDSNS